MVLNYYSAVYLQNRFYFRNMKNFKVYVVLVQLEKEYNQAYEDQVACWSF